MIRVSSRLRDAPLPQARQGSEVGGAALRRQREGLQVGKMQEVAAAGRQARAASPSPFTSVP